MHLMNKKTAKNTGSLLIKISPCLNILPMAHLIYPIVYSYCTFNVLVKLELMQMVAKLDQLEPLPSPKKDLLMKLTI